MMKILGRTSSSNVQKILWLADEIGIELDRDDYGGRFGKTNEVAYLDINPTGLVPTLIDDDFTLWESNSICRYLADKCQAEQLYPKPARLRAECERWMDWQLSSIGALMPQLYMQLVRTAPEERDLALIDKLRARSNLMFAILDNFLGARRFLVGDDLALADIVLGPWTYRWFALELYDREYSELRQWYDRLAERPAYRRHVMVPLE